jgi:hypothetical protein
MHCTLNPKPYTLYPTHRPAHCCGAVGNMGIGASCAHVRIGVYDIRVCDYLILCVCESVSTGV